MISTSVQRCRQIELNEAVTAACSTHAGVSRKRTVSCVELRRSCLSRSDTGSGTWSSSRRDVFYQVGWCVAVQTTMNSHAIILYWTRCLIKANDDHAREAT